MNNNNETVIRIHDQKTAIMIDEQRKVIVIKPSDGLDLSQKYDHRTCEFSYEFFVMNFEDQDEII